MTPTVAFRIYDIGWFIIGALRPSINNIWGYTILALSQLLIKLVTPTPPNYFILYYHIRLTIQFIVSYECNN